MGGRFSIDLAAHFLWNSVVWKKQVTTESHHPVLLRIIVFPCSNFFEIQPVKRYMARNKFPNITVNSPSQGSRRVSKALRFVFQVLRRTCKGLRQRIRRGDCCFTRGVFQVFSPSGKNN